MIPVFAVLPVTDAQYESVFALHERLFRPYIEKIWGWHPDWQQQNFRRNWSDCSTQVIESGGELIGYQQVLAEDDAVLLKNLGLLPAFQGRGIGAQLVRTLQSTASARGVPIKLSVFSTNPGAVRFYECMGFVIKDRTDEFQHMLWKPMPA